MLAKLFAQYMKVTRGIKDKSVGHYITGINTINSILQRYAFPINDVFNVSSVTELDTIREFLDNNEEFRQKDSIGHNMYSVAFNHFYRFACEDHSFFRDHIAMLDVPVEKPKITATSLTRWPRNQIIVSQALDGAHYRCELDPRHMTFISRVSGNPYMEGHHLIPIKHQPLFEHGIDVYSNVICLCPICHRMMHYGRDKDRTIRIEKLYEQRQDRMVKSGIDISKAELLELALR